MRRKYRIILAAIPVLLVAADLIYWQIASTRLRSGLQDWIAERRAEGWTVQSDAFTTGGWPQAATITVPNLAMSHAGQDMPGQLAWQAAGVAVSLSLYHPTTLDISLIGPQHVRIGEAPTLTVTGERLDMAVGLGSQQATPLNLRAKTVVVAPVAGDGRLTIGLLTADATVAPAAAQSQPAVALSLSTEAIALPATLKSPLGPNISSLAIDGALNGPLPSVRAMPAWAAAWRDGGGSLDVAHLALGWGPLGLTGSATLALDDQLQPMGSGSSRLVGYAATLDRFAASGVLSRSAATAAKAVLSLMADTPDSDTPSAVDVPLTLQYRTLSMRQVPLIRLPELDWSAR